MVQYKVGFPKCKRCGREPSRMGKEPMFLAPYNLCYYILCGGCFEKIMNKFGKKPKHDLSNLFTHEENYHQFMREFLHLKI